jgi:hypothetical protein
MLETGSFRPSVYSADLAGLGSAVVFKTSALNHSAIPPHGNHSGKSFRKRAVYRPFAGRATVRAGLRLIHDQSREDDIR